MQQIVYTCHHTMRSGGKITDSYSDLIFIEGVPLLVLSWAARGQGPGITVPLNHRRLSVSPDDEAGGSDLTYSEMIDDPRH